MANKIGSIIGRGAPSYQIASSAIIAVVSLFYIYTVASQLHLRVYPLVHRITYYTNFQAYIISEYVDHIILGGLLVAWLAISTKRSIANYGGVAILGAVLVTLFILTIGAALNAIALASLPIIAGSAIFSTYIPSKGILKNLNSNLIFNHISIVATIAGIVTLVYALIGVATGNIPQTTVRSYAYDIYLIFSSFSPVLLLSLIACIPVKVLINSICRYLKNRKFGAAKPALYSVEEGKLGNFKKFLILSLIVLLSIMIALVPHLQSVNKNGQQVSVDTGYYVTWVSALKATHSVSDLLFQAFVNQNGGDRPLSLILLYGFDQLTNSNLTLTVEFVAVILGPALVLVMYFLTRELTSSSVTSLMASFFTAVSFQMLIGIYAGFYANWIALILGYLSFIFLFKFLNKGRVWNLVFYGTLTVMTLFAHVYTWSVLSIVEGLLIAVAILRPNKISCNGRREAVLLLIILLSTVLLDIARTSIVGSSGGVEKDLELANTLVNPQYFVLRWNHLSYTTTTFVGGIFANFIVLSLGLYWLWRAKLQDATTIFLMIFLSVGILPFLVGDWIVQTRVFYNIPFQIPAAIGATYMIQHTFRRTVVTLPTFLWILSIAIITVSNFYLVSPRPSS